MRSAESRATVSWLRRNFILLGAVTLGIVLGIVALRIYDNSSKPQIVIRDASQARTISVQVSGAVELPGVYELDPDARIGDAIDAAGGATANADLAQLNLARRLTDGENILIPAIQPTPGPGTVVSASANDLVNINEASGEELE